MLIFPGFVPHKFSKIVGVITGKTFFGRIPYAHEILKKSRISVFEV
jgi:hypothetical protein